MDAQTELLKTPFGEDSRFDIWTESTAPAELGFTLDDASADRLDLVVSAVHRPQCLAFTPATPNGGAVLVFAGGGYTKLVAGKEGVEVALWLTGLGYHAFVLLNRFPCAAFTEPARNGMQAPVDDAIEAMRVLRARSGEFGFDPGKLGVLGLSSGGHLAACLTARYPAAWTPLPSSAIALSARPDFSIIGYAPISTNAAGRTMTADKAPLPPPEKQALYDALQPDSDMLDAPPPAFIFYAASDPIVPVENAVRLHKAYLDRGGSADLHIFADAPHGFAMRTPDLPAGAWPQLCATWMRNLLHPR